MKFHVTSDHVVLTLGSLMLIAVLVSIYRLQRDKESTFNIFDLVMSGGVLVPDKTILMMAFVLHTFLIVYWALQETAASEDMLIYAGIWVTPTLAKAIKGGEQQAPCKKDGPP